MATATILIIFSKNMGAYCSHAMFHIEDKKNIDIYTRNAFHFLSYVIPHPNPFPKNPFHSFHEIHSCKYAIKLKTFCSTPKIVSIGFWYNFVNYQNEKQK